MQLLEWKANNDDMQWLLVH